IKNYNRVLRKVKEIQSINIIFSILFNGLDTIKDVLDNHLVVSELLKDKKLLVEYNHLKEELKVYKETYNYGIENYINYFYEFHKDVSWYHNKKEVRLKSDVDVENLVSDIMWLIYPDTPIIGHDSINRFKVRGVQKRSLYEVVDRIL